MKERFNKTRLLIIAAGVLLSVFGLAAFVQMNLTGQEAAGGQIQTAPIRGFSNMCPYEGRVYCGINGTYGEQIPKQSSIFTIWDGKLYYVEKVQEAYDSLTDELLSIKRSDMDGSHEEVLAEDVFLAGAGHEQLIGDKLFYGYGYDENYRMRYACVDVNTKERTDIATDRMDTIIGYDGSWLYYCGTDPESGENLLGRIHVENGKDETVCRYAAADEEGYIDSVKYMDGQLYCFTLVNRPEGYDYRTFGYRLIIRDGADGHVKQELPHTFSGTANYSFLIQDGEACVTSGGEIAAMSLTDGSVRSVVKMEEGEYWEILHFIPGDGYLYYEAISENCNENGSNDFFYRVPFKGGRKELLKEWFMI